MSEKQYTCPVCKSKNLYFKHEASYVYSYVLDFDAPGIKNDEIFSPYLYDRREQTSSHEYVECEHCKTRFQSDLLYNMLVDSENKRADNFT
jgi:DNA-directed RNA polymerase subunit RPC12/RpoP